MSRIYSKAFKVGVAINILVFAIINTWSYAAAKRAHDASNIRFAPGFDWGFPFSWFWDTGIGLGFMLNFMVIALCSFIVGFIFRSLSTKGK